MHDHSFKYCNTCDVVWCSQCSLECDANSWYVYPDYRWGIITLSPINMAGTTTAVANHAEH